MQAMALCGLHADMSASSLSTELELHKGVQGHQTYSFVFLQNNHHF